MKPWEVVATLLNTPNQLRVQVLGKGGTTFVDENSACYRAAIFCPRTGKEITFDNVRQIQVEHWPISHRDGGPVSPDNALISLSEGHLIQTKKESQGRGKERRLRIARRAKAEVEQRVGKKKYRLKKKVSGEVVRVLTR